MLKSITSIERILVLVFGATTGATLHEFRVNSGFRLLWRRNIPWIMDDGSVYLWPMDWLDNLLSEVKAMATPDTIIASAMWGADVLHLSSRGSVADKVLHYRSVPPGFADKLMSNSGIPKHEWSRLMGHVHAEFYQMVFTNAFWREYTTDRNYTQVVPLADWITAQLSGQLGHDPVMLHNQGAGIPTSQLVNRFFDCDGLSEFAPVWRVFDNNELLPLTNGTFIVPCTHDSALARLVLGSTNLPWGLWTGSWYGVCHTIKEGKNFTPGEKTYSAGLVFEATPNDLTAISNIGMHGPKWKALKDAQGAKSYDEAARLALEWLPEAAREGRVFPRELLDHQDPDAFAKGALAQACGNLSLPLAAMANTIAVYSKDGLTHAAEALGIEAPRQIAIVGGFAENEAILAALKLHGLTPVIPPFASMATQAGMAARALCLSGATETITEALSIFPNVVLTD